MKTKIRYTKEYLLLIDEEAEIQKGGYAYQVNYEKTNIQIIKIESDFQEKIANDKNGTFTKYKIIAYYPLTKEVKELDLPLLPNPFEEDKYIKDLAQQRWGNVHRTGVLGFIEGYKAAQSKQFSLEDVEYAITQAFLKGIDRVEFNETIKEEIIQSLSTQQLPKEFVPKYDRVRLPKGEDGWKDVYQLKTTINSEDKEIVVGKWIY